MTDGAQTEILNNNMDATSADVGGDTPPTEDPSPIGFNACTFSWDTFVGSASAGKQLHRRHGGRRSRDRFELRFDGEVKFARGALNLIVGPTACGKVRYELVV